MLLVEHVHAWLRGNAGLSPLLDRVEQLHVPRMGRATLDSVVQLYAILALCPDAAAKLSCSYSRGRVEGGFVPSVKAFNQHRKDLLLLVYEHAAPAFCIDEALLKALEGATQVQCNPIHAPGGRINSALLTCVDRSSARSSWVVQQEHLGLLKSFYELRHFHDTVGLVLSIWCRHHSHVGPRETLDRVCVETRLFMQSEHATYLRQLYRAVVGDLQACFLSYI
jgi:hypothetical protein